jgi:hypothetical protein
MDTTETDADGCILLEYEGEWRAKNNAAAQGARRNVSGKGCGWGHYGKGSIDP